MNFDRVNFFIIGIITGLLALWSSLSYDVIWMTFVVGFFLALMLSLAFYELVRYGHIRTREEFKESPLSIKRKEFTPLVLFSVASFYLFMGFHNWQIATMWFYLSALTFFAGFLYIHKEIKPLPLFTFIEKFMRKSSS